MKWLKCMLLSGSKSITMDIVIPSIVLLKCIEDKTGERIDQVLHFPQLIDIFCHHIHPQSIID